MGRSREAICTIKGYLFQFDYYILELPKLENDDEMVCIEGVEDVDIIKDDDIEAVQCKYYEETECKPSIIAKALRPMLHHYAEYKKDDVDYHYRIFGHYKSGQESIKMPITVDYAKEKFFTYTAKSKNHKVYNELGLNDDDIEDFLNRLTLQIDVCSYEEQIETIINLIKSVMQCTEYDARYFYYTNAISFVKEIAVKKKIEERTITKRLFLQEICKKRYMFDKWYIEFIGFKKYYKDIRRTYFSEINISPINRFFLIECDQEITDAELSMLIKCISKKWSRLSKREKNPFCPYICIYGILSTRLVNIKNNLFKNGIHIRDGYEYKDADFSSRSITRPVNYYTGVHCRIINEICQVDEILNSCDGGKEVYQFYLKNPSYNREDVMGADFRILKTDDVNNII